VLDGEQVRASRKRGDGPERMFLRPFGRRGRRNNRLALSPLKAPNREEAAELVGVAAVR
jgi:hypothetical protein